MNKSAIFAFIFIIFLPTILLAKTSNITLPKAISNIKNPTLIGNSNLKFLGFKVYEISLWCEDPKFSYDKEFAIQINYNMSFSKEDLAKKSIKEIEKLHNLTKKEKDSYYKKLQEIFVSVKKGDEKTALFIPNKGVTLFYNNKISGKISDLKLSRLFVDIWLDERGSYPDVTRKILGKTN